MAKCQRNRQKISLFLVFVMLCTQLLLAQHSTVHFNEDEYAGIAYQHTGQHEPPADHPAHHKNKICQICVFGKVLSHSFPVASVDIPKPVFAVSFDLPVARESSTRHETRPLQARAPPPSFLS